MIQQKSEQSQATLAEQERYVKLYNLGIPCYYARFHQPVPNSNNKEPVGEFKLKASTELDKKYVVFSMRYTPHGLLYETASEIAIVPLANIIYCRLSVMRP